MRNCSQCPETTVMDGGIPFCETCLEKSATENLKNFGTPERVMCGYCGEWFQYGEVAVAHLFFCQTNSVFTPTEERIIDGILETHKDLFQKLAEQEEAEKNNADS